ncbi:hypothetical protein DFS34DRAFT_621174 [Phlyctochytrium arcticum]|nr:hypothetical protein DFS34DRAFT_621174 [Phlyctochytrium arcticum]
MIKGTSDLIKHDQGEQQLRYEIPPGVLLDAAHPPATNPQAHHTVNPPLFDSAQIGGYATTQRADFIRPAVIRTPHGGKRPQTDQLWFLNSETGEAPADRMAREEAEVRAGAPHIVSATEAERCRSTHMRDFAVPDFDIAKSTLRLERAHALKPAGLAGDKKLGTKNLGPQTGFQYGSEELYNQQKSALVRHPPTQSTLSNPRDQSHYHTSSEYARRQTIFLGPNEQQRGAGGLQTFADWQEPTGCGGCADCGGTMTRGEEMRRRQQIVSGGGNTRAVITTGIAGK